MTDNADEIGLAEAEVRAAMARAGLQVQPAQFERLVAAHRHMQSRLAELRSQLDSSIVPALVFPAAAWRKGGPRDE
jgi:hypothetical protein